MPQDRHSPETAFFDKLASISGAARQPSASGVSAHAAPAVKVAAAEPAALTKIADMELSAVIDDPRFSAAFNRRLLERMPELDAAVADLA